MVKQVDTRDLKSLSESCPGSSPGERTKNTQCKVCKLHRRKDNHDPCIRNLPGVKYACCGHGGIGYIYFENGTVIRFPFLTAVEYTDPKEDFTLFADFERWGKHEETPYYFKKDEGGK